MIASLIIIGIAFYWLLEETDWLTIRLPYGKSLTPEVLMLNAAPVVLALPAPRIIDQSIPYYWKSQEQREAHMIICHNCRTWADCKERKKQDRWVAWELPAKTIKAWGQTFNLYGGCNMARANLLRELAQSQMRKPSHTVKYAQLPLGLAEVRVGSHQDWIPTDDKGHGYHRCVEDYTTVYHPCLVSREWLEAHKDDRFPEPTIEIAVDGGKSLSLNGNYKKGMIKDFMGQYCKPGEGKTRLVKTATAYRRTRKSPATPIPNDIEALAEAALSIAEKHLEEVN